VHDYRKLRVWQEAHQLALGVFAVSPHFARPEAWALREQLLRAAISIPSNIAEGRGRGSDPDFKRFLWHSLGSCNELEYDLQLASEVGFLPEKTQGRLAEQVVDVRRMLTGLVQTMSR
jgi:four helix bundle protein